jgi:glutathione S-transferase
MTASCCATPRRSWSISPSKYDPSGLWYPQSDAEMQGKVAQWLGFADGITATASAARLHDSLFYDVDIDKARAGAHALFRVLDEHLWFAEQEGQDWLCSTGHPTIADIACFPYVMLSEEGGISRLPYPAIRRWTDRVKRIPGFTVMPGFSWPIRCLPPDFWDSNRCRFGIGVASFLCYWGLETEG